MTMAVLPCPWPPEHSLPASTRVNIVDMYNSDHVKITQIASKGMGKVTSLAPKAIIFKLWEK